MSQVARQIQHQEQIRKQPTRQTKRIVRQKRKWFTKGEKVLFSLFIATVFLFVGLTIQHYASVYAVNKDIHGLESAVAQQTELNEGLSLQVVELSRPDRILQIAEGLGMSLNENNVKVVQD